MELQLSKNTLIFTDNQDTSLKKEEGTLSTGRAKKLPIFDDLIDEAGEDVFNYLDKFGITQNSNLILLSSVRHYLYGSEELEKVSTVVNLKLMNHITFIRYCLQAMNQILPVGGNFIGCFFDSEKNKRNRKTPHASVSKSELLFKNSFEKNSSAEIPMFNWIYKLFNRRKFKSLSRNNARSILEKNGFLVLEMTEINGITYFISKKMTNLRHESYSFLKPPNKGGIE